MKKNRLIFFFILCINTLVFSNEHSLMLVKDQNRLEIHTPSLKERTTAKVRLSNGLEAYLISDPGADQSAAAFAMDVGSWSDPDSYPGIAHFCEHLLFMGSKTYPIENGFEKQVLDHGGLFNAYTASDRTVYIFSVNHDAYTETLDQFSHMFIDPLFSASGVGRELNAVDQEHDKNLEHDGYREFMVLKATGNQEHPNARFNSGNSKTLQGVPREEVEKWYKENYSSDKAHLVLYSPLPLNELISLTKSYFSSVPTNSHLQSLPYKTLLSPSQKGHLITINPIKDVRQLTIVWELSKEHSSNLENCSHQLLFSMLKSKHPNSLYDQLKKKGLIEDLSVGTLKLSKENTLFEIGFYLTPQGVKEYKSVLENCFDALYLVKSNGIPKFIFDEIKQMAKIDYEYQSRTPSFHYVQHLADQMTREPLETFPQKSTLPTSYQERDNSELLSLLTPQNASYFLMAPLSLTLVEHTLNEKWSGAEYTICPMDSAELNFWGKELKNVSLKIPEPNPYIPSNLQLVTLPFNSDQLPHPQLVNESKWGKVYYWEDVYYRSPKVSWIFHFKSPLINGSTTSRVMTDLYLRGVEQATASTCCYAEAASLFANNFLDDLDITIRIDGKSDKAFDLLKAFLNEMQTSHMTKEEFELERASLATQYKNSRKAMPYLQSIEEMNHLLFNIFPTNNEKLIEIEKISYEEYLAFSTELFNVIYVEAMLTGNLSHNQAESIWQEIEGRFGHSPYLKEDHIHKGVLTLNPDKGPYKIVKKSESLGNAALLVLQEGPYSKEKKASASILGAALKEEFFTELRTKQQTAYIAKTFDKEVESQLLKLFLVQSSTHEPEELIARFDLFLENYTKDFEKMLPEGRFEELRVSLITKLQTREPNLSSMATHLDHLAFTHQGNFDRNEQQVAALKTINYDRFKQDTLALLSRNNKNRIAILLKGRVPEDKMFQYQEISVEDLKNKASYTSLK